jgi:Fe-S-cluster-containing hydrogenase component 2
MDQGQAAEAPIAKQAEPSAYAFLGVRACELAAISIQDRILCGDGRDPHYTRLRLGTLIIGVHCQTAAATCFCPSMGTGPDFPSSGYDLLLTEFSRFFLIQSGSIRGDEILEKLCLPKALDEAPAMIEEQLVATRDQIMRTLPQKNIKEDIYGALDSSYWQEIGQRCLACANCTMVCPTCFCSTNIDKKLMTADGTREQASRTQVWDSCFHLDFTLMHGGNTRVSTDSRYRQWLSHKLASWIDQFGTSGCVGCGRCITWCPVGIDLTEEIAHLRKSSPHLDCPNNSETPNEP